MLSEPHSLARKLTCLLTLPCPTLGGSPNQIGTREGICHSVAMNTLNALGNSTVKRDRRCCRATSTTQQSSGHLPEIATSDTCIRSDDNRSRMDTIPV